MLHQFKNLLQLQKHFNNELICAQYVEQMRWGGKPLCPHCGSEHHWRTKSRLKHPDLATYKDFWCKACNKKYTVLTGSIFESSKVSLQTWFSAMYLIAAHKKGISSVQLASDLGITQKSAWFVLHRARAMMMQNFDEKLSGEIEIDETYIGGKEKNKHASKRNKTKITGMDDKQPVIGFMQRNGFVRVHILEKDTKVTKELMHPLIRKYVTYNSTLYTDGHGSYFGLGIQYNEHHVVDHIQKEYVKDKAHTNTIEGFWSIMKRGIYGIYHFVSAKHLHRYCDEFTYRYNMREISDIDKFKLALLQSNERRLKYYQLVGREPK